MTKTLTEQWREGTLPEGLYYTKGAFDDDIYISHFDYEFEEDKRLPVEEVLAPVPSYDEFKRLQEQLDEAIKTTKDQELIIKKLKRRRICDNQKTEARKEHINELIEQVKELKEEIARRGRIINELKIQRKEANNIIKQYCFYEYGKPYLKKWGVE